MLKRFSLLDKQTSGIGSKLFLASCEVSWSFFEAVSNLKLTKTMSRSRDSFLLSNIILQTPRERKRKRFDGYVDESKVNLFFLFTLKTNCLFLFWEKAALFLLETINKEVFVFCLFFQCFLFLLFVGTRNKKRKLKKLVFFETLVWVPFFCL